MNHQSQPLSSGRHSDKSLFDISIPIQSGMVQWPGDPPIQIETTLDVSKGDPATVRTLTLGSHTGTHVDAFSHFNPAKGSLDEMDLSPYLGKALVVSIPSVKEITGPLLEQSITGMLDLDIHALRGQRLLLKTKNSDTPWFKNAFNPEFCHLNPNCVPVLEKWGISLVGIDYLSVEGYDVNGAPTHHALIQAGIYILEGIYLGDIVPGWYELLCLPLKIHQGDGAMARAVLRAL
ncbi:MAG: cyclase family protein [Cyanobacteria bacterium]|nr:cyclase family protein [Cyanobacteriota bacterium]